MAEIKPMECAGLFSMWLQSKTGPDVAEKFAANIGYKVAPLFGKKKARVRLMGELAMVYVALAIYAINLRHDADAARSIIDPFLEATRKTHFSALERHYPNFESVYPQRMQDYFQVLEDANPALGVSFAFLRNLGIDPLTSLEAQLHLVAVFSTTLQETLDVLDRLELQA